MKRRSFLAASVGAALLAGCSDPATTSRASAGRSTSELVAPLADWDFSSATPYETTTTGRDVPPLRQGTGSAVRLVADRDFGTVASFNGVSDYLVVPADELNDLDFSVGDEVTILAWVKRATAGDGFLGGIWSEDSARPGRCAGMFVNLRGYGGQDSVCGHVSKTGGPSPGLPFSRDYAASARGITPGRWRAVAMSLGPGSVTSYLDGLADPRPVYQEPGPPYGQSLTYSKNPYRWTAGLNRTSKADFTVGATALTGGMSHFLEGEIAHLTVFGRGLSQAEVLAWMVDTKPPSLPLFVFDGWRRSKSSYSTWGGSSASFWAPKTFGWSSVSGPTAKDASATSDTWSYVSSTQSYLRMPAATTSRFTYYDSIRSIPLSHITKLTLVLNTVSASDSTQLCLKTADHWWMCDDPLVRQPGGGPLEDGTTSQSRELLMSTLATARWRPLTVTPDQSMTAGPAREFTVSDDELQGVGFYCLALENDLRVGDLTIWG
jgi:hypothetical protein